MNSEISIDYYVNYKNKLQDYFNKLNREQLIELFNIILNHNANIPYSKNKNGYFLDIKLLPSEIIEKLEEKCIEYINILQENLSETSEIPINI
jgi:hypothetical protein